MTTLSDDLVGRIARLSRLKMTPEELHRYRGELNKILNYFNQLSTVPSDLEELKLGSRDDSVSRLRPDETQDLVSTADFLNQTPDREGVFLRVPAVLDRIT